MRKYILPTLIIASGIFNYVIISMSRFYPAQFAFFVFGAGTIGSLLLYEKNKWLGLLAGLCALCFLKSYLMLLGPHMELFKEVLTGASILIIYYGARQLRLKGNILKFFLIPASLNIILMIAQAFDHTALTFMPVNRVTGFLGNASVSACFIAMTIPIFLRYFKWGLPFALFAVLLSGSETALAICIISALFYLYYTDIKKFRKIAIVTIVGILLFMASPQNRNRTLVDLRHRACMWVGTLDGIMHNPIFGWGIGNFESIMENLKPEETEYLGDRFNTGNVFMNHPHNEILLGWWYMGVLFPIFFVGLCIGLKRKFTVKKVLPFSIVLGGFICMIGYFLSPPAWFLLAMSLGIYENT